MKNFAHLLIPLVAALAFGSYPVSGFTEQSDPEISTSLDQLTGIWSSEGYGQILIFEDGSPGRFERYEITDVSCLLVSSGRLDDFQNALVKVLRNTDGTRFSHSYPGVLSSYTYHRLDELPAHCGNGGTEFDPDPLFNFDVFWATFSENYAFFSERGVDWEALREQVRSDLTASSSEKDLFDALVRLVTPLCDGHVELASEFAAYNGGVNEVCLSENILLQEILQEFERQTEFSDPFEYFQRSFKPSVLQIIENGYVQGRLTSAARGHIQWGSLGGGIGYVSILQMTNYAGPESTPAQDLAALAPALDEIMDGFADHSALVLDIRLNTGGYDHVALDIASRFTDRPRIAFTKKARAADGFTAKQLHALSSGDRPRFNRPVVILTSALTASAAENFLLAMLPIPQLGVIGEKTTGVHSDVLERHLPNGWMFSLSNEVYETPDGKLYEGQGIAPDIEVAVLRSEDRAMGRDTGLEAALERLAHGPVDPGLRGTWWNPERSGEGYLIDFLQFGSQRLLFVTFYTYDSEGNQVYLVGQSTDFSNPVTLDMGITQGGVFGAGYNPDNQQLEHWGTLTIDFHSCMESTVTLTPEVQGFEAYSTLLERFGEPAFEDLNCS